MSTQLRRLAQAPAHTPVRTKFFLTVAALTPNQGNAGDSAVSLDSEATLPAEAVVTQTNFSSIFDAYGGSTIGVNALLRDLGRSVTVVAADGTHLYRYRQVQIVNGSGSEGVGGSSPDWNSNLYVLVWAANGENVNVVRTG